MGINAFEQQLNEWGRSEKPFFFLIDFEKQNPLILPLADAQKQGIYFQLEDQRNFTPTAPANSPRIRHKKVLDYTHYQRAFDRVQQHLQQGDSYLLNLTFPTPIDLEGTLRDVFFAAQSTHKLYLKDRFVCFSPERFIQIQNNQISTYPMKGTADAQNPAAAQKILQNSKELWEHSTTVDLLRNDLSIHAHRIEVDQFRYLDTIETSDKKLLQVSSKISGHLNDDWKSKIGTLLWEMLPAGSVSGAPKTKTCDIIASVEAQNRGYYTGVYGIFDGTILNSAVAIRYIELKEGQYYYRSGGGITAQSNCQEEYDELIQKIYVPAL